MVAMLQPRYFLQSQVQLYVSLGVPPDDTMKELVQLKDPTLAQKWY
jgi:hypothetical protein